MLSIPFLSSRQADVPFLLFTTIDVPAATAE